MPDKFKEGDIVVDRARPYSKLMIMRREGSMLYCKDMEFSNRKLLVYFERDLRSPDTLTTAV